MKNFFEKKDNTPERILPFDVRYALEHKGGILNKEDLEVLLKTNFEKEGIYLLIKSLRSNPEEHKKLLEKYINCILAKKDREELHKFIDEELNSRDQISVDGVKLAQLSRQGFSHWQEKFRSLSKDMSNTDKNIFLLAHATLLGLDSFVEEFSKNNKSFNIIVPAWVENKSKNIGYKVLFNNGKLDFQFLTEPFQKDSAIIIDDTIGTGNTTNVIKKYWINQGGQEPEIKAIVTK